MKNVDCALLPPCQNALHFHLPRSRYVALMWSQASAADPTENLSPEDYGWHLHEGMLRPTWFQGQCFPDNLFTNENNFEDSDDSDSEDDADEAWSEESDYNDD